MQGTNELSNISGILVVNKPSGPTSRDIVNDVSRVLRTRKIGHTGTLDPLASGVLILTVGKCTKLSELLTSKYKTYEAEVYLGYETDTLDITGKTLKSSEKCVTREEIEKTIDEFKGKYLQEVPSFSAVKVNGKKLYEYAREGIEIELPKREVEIKDIEILEIEDKRIKIVTTVSKGTYIRSLIRDIGMKLGTFATMTKLVRTKQGEFSLEWAYTLEQIKNGSYSILTPEEVLKDVHTIDTSDDMELYKKVSNGCKLELNLEHEFIKFTCKNKVIALYKKNESIYKMYVKM